MTDVGALQFLPRPWQLTEESGTFALDAATRIVLAPDAAETLFAAGGLQAAIAQQTGITPPIATDSATETGNSIALVHIGRDAARFPATTWGWTWHDDLGAQGYMLHVTSEQAVIAAASDAGLFYGVQTLIQLVRGADRRWPALTIADRPALPVRGLMLDVSRHKVPTPEFLARLIRTLAHYKYNHFQLYTEHTFAFPSHPEIGADAGSITGEDIRALDALCRAHHIELVPNFQSLGHQRALLSLPRYRHLAETPWKWSLATANEAIWPLLDDLYADLLPNFTSGWLNVDADEPWDSGRGQSAALTAEIGVGRVYLRHILRLRALAAKHGKRMMMWADVLPHHPDLIAELPDDILLLDWWYEAKPRYDTVDALARAGREFYVCPGTASWSTLFPRLENAIVNIRTFVRDGIAAGATGMLLTDWGDGGHYQMISHSWHPYLWGAECGWTGSTTESADFDVAFSNLFLGDRSGAQVAALRRLGAAMQTAPRWVRTWNTAMALFEEPLTGPMAGVATPEIVAETHAAAEALLPLLGSVRDDEMRHDLGFTVAQICFATEKVETTRTLRAVLNEMETGDPGPETLARFDRIVGALQGQRAALPALVREFEARWLAHARRSEIHVNLDRFAALAARYDAALAWLADQREAYTSGADVDAALTTYVTDDYRVIFQESWHNVEELIAIIGLDALPADIRAWHEIAVASNE
jgi:hexosaminidase